MNYPSEKLIILSVTGSQHKYGIKWLMTVKTVHREVNTSFYCMTT